MTSDGSVETDEEILEFIEEELLLAKGDKLPVTAASFERLKERFEELRLENIGLNQTFTLVNSRIHEAADYYREATKDEEFSIPDLNVRK